MRNRIFVCAFLLLSLIGCSRSEYEVIYNAETGEAESRQPDQANSYTIAVIPKVSGIPYFNAAEEGALEAGSDLGVNVLYKGPLIADWRHQSEIIESFIEKDVDAIAVSANDPDKLGSVLTEAMNQGIKVMTWDSDTSPVYRSLYINMVDPEVLGRHVMDTLASRLEEKGEFAILTDSKQAANTNEWIHWMKVQHAEYYPAMELVDIRETDDSPTKAYDAATELLNEREDLDGIIGASSVGPPAAVQAVLDADKQDDIEVVGLSTPNLMRAFIQDGQTEIVTLWSPKRLGYLTVSIAKSVLEGNQPADNQYFPNIGVIRVEGDTVIMGRPIDFTRENIDEYDF